MLLNILGHNIDGNDESLKIYGAKTARDRLAPGREPSLPHPGVRRFFCTVQIIHIFFHISYFLKTTIQYNTIRFISTFIHVNNYYNTLNV